MLQEYLPILIFLIVAGGFGLVLIVLGFGAGTVLGVRRPDPDKLAPYECGFEAFEDTRRKFDVRYYLVTMIFIVFDLEIIFFFPWAATLREVGVPYMLAAMTPFFLILTLGLAYEWRKGALEWD